MVLIRDGGPVFYTGAKKSLLSSDTGTVVMSFQHNCVFVVILNK
jgi:hypothetical protein